MKVYSDSIFNYGSFCFKEDNLSSLTNQQKKIVIIASIAIGCFVVCYLAIRYYTSRVNGSKKIEALPKPFNDEKKAQDNQAKNLREIDTELTEDEKWFVDYGLRFNKGKTKAAQSDLVKDSHKPAVKVMIQPTYQSKTLPDGRICEGTFDENLNGQGTITYSYGRVEKGDFKEGKLHGHGKYTYLNTEYEGEFVNSQLNGQGKITYSSGMISKGEFRQGLLHGQGIINCPDGTIKKGEFRQGRLEGQGTMNDSNGRIKQGEFADDQLNGRGKVFFLGQIVAEGIFKNDKLHGQGTMTCPDGTIKKGEFQDGEFKQGTITLTDRRVFEGNFDDQLNGEGKMTLQDGTIEEGTFINGELNGQGEITYGEKPGWKGAKDKGEFKGSKLNGQGIRTARDGSIFEGQFKEGRLKQGKKTLPHSHSTGQTVEEGEFKDGELEGEGKRTCWGYEESKRYEYVERGEFKINQLGMGQLYEGTRTHDTGRITVVSNFHPSAIADE